MDIRKSDSKGRVTVGAPDTYYGVLRGPDGAITIAPIDGLDQMQEDLIKIASQIPKTVTLTEDHIKALQKAIQPQINVGPPEVKPPSRAPVPANKNTF